MPDENFEVNERFGSQYVTRLPDKDHPGIAMYKSSYISDADREWELSTQNKPVEVKFVSKDGMQTVGQMSIDLSRFTPQQLAWAAKQGRDASHRSDTQGGRIRRLTVTLEKLKEIEMSQPEQAGNRQSDVPAPTGYPTPTGRPYLPGQGSAWQPSGAMQPPAQPLQEYYAQGATRWVPQEQVLPPPPLPNGDGSQKQAAPPSSGLPGGRPPQPYQAPFQAAGGTLPLPPRVKVEFRSDSFGSMVVPYHHVTVQRTPYGEPFAVYLTIDNRFEGSVRYMAENFETAYVYVPGESVWFQVAATGLVFDFQDPARDIDQSTAVLFIAATQPAR